jgi:NADH dehydrogenase
VAIIGAGFGGINAARALADQAIDATIIDRNNFHTFQPLLYQVATAGLNTADVAYVVRGIFHRDPTVHFRQGSVTGVDWTAKEVQIEGEDPVPFDYLVVAAGSSTNFFGIEGAEEHAFPLYSLADATKLRNHILSCFEQADADPELIKTGLLTFVVVGGGPTGVEVAGALAELVDMVLSKDYKMLDLSQARVVLVERADRLLPPFAESSAAYAGKILDQRGVDVRLGTSVEAIMADRVVLGGGERLDAHTLIWGAGIQAGSIAGALGVDQGRGGRIVVENDLRIPGHPEAFAIGDIAEIADGHGGHLPQLAQVAIQGGRHVAAEIAADLDGGGRKEFHYLDKGTMATIGRRAAVAELPLGVKLRGSIAWLAWLALHIVYLLGMRNRASVLVNWAWNYFTWDRGPRLIFQPPPDADEPDTPVPAEEV